MPEWEKTLTEVFPEWLAGNATVTLRWRQPHSKPQFPVITGQVKVERIDDDADTVTASYTRPQLQACTEAYEAMQEAMKGG